MTKRWLVVALLIIAILAGLSLALASIDTERELRPVREPVALPDAN